MGMIHTLMVSCRKASVLIERRELRSLSVPERLGLWYHLCICDACKTYEKQSALIDRWLEERRDSSAPADAEAVRESIYRRIDLPR